MKMASGVTILWVATVIIGLSLAANAQPTVEDRFDVSDGYTDSILAKPEADGGKRSGSVSADDDRLWPYQDSVAIPIGSSALMFIILSGSFIARCSSLALSFPVRKSP